LIANRGEIAVRIAATCQALGHVAVAIFTAADRHALHVRAADEAYPLGPATTGAAGAGIAGTATAGTLGYLDVERVVEAALEARADALHPGYGFLSENPALADACAAAGITFIGPTAAAMRLLGSKIAAKGLARQAGVPTVPGYDGAEQDDATLLEQARAIGVPLLIKAAAGGGGRGMREVHDLALFPEALAAARREARGAFGDDTVLLEQLVERPRHVEFQLFGDRFGSVIHLGERECSVQRRHQKIVEEAPSPAVSPALRAEMGAAAVRVAKAAGYTNAGTAEFMLAPDGRYYFLEMNARLQVEHPVTELVTGLDLVALQLRLAAGEPLPFAQDEVRLRGHALECRVYAEDPAAGFLPSTGRLLVFDPPRGPGVRVDTGVVVGDEVTVYYDPMLAKLITSGETRREAIDRGLWALHRFPVLGVTTNTAFLARVVDHPAFRAGELSTDFVAEHLTDAVAAPAALAREALLLAALWQTTTPVVAASGHIGERVQTGRMQDAPTPSPWQTTPSKVGMEGSRSWDPWRAGSGWSLGTTRTLQIAYGEAEHTVTLRGDGGGGWDARAGGDAYTVTVAERDHDATAAGGLTLRLDGRVARGHVAPRDGALLVSYQGVAYELRVAGPPDVDTLGSGSGRTAAGDKSLTAPMPGTVIRVDVREGDRVEAQQRLAVLEAMKMEHPIEAPYAGVVRAVLHREGDLVTSGERLIELEESDNWEGP